MQQGILLAGRSLSEAWAAAWKGCRDNPEFFEWRRGSLSAEAASEGPMDCAKDAHFSTTAITF